MNWNKSFTLPLFLIFQFSIAKAAPESASELMNKLEAGQCYSDPESKNYLQSVKPKPERYSVLVKAIGIEKINRLTDTYANKYYFCQVTCKDQNLHVSQTWVTLSESEGRLNQMEAFLCPSVQIENLSPDKPYATFLPVAKIFSSYNSSYPELHQWLLQTDFRIDTTTYEKYWEEAQPKLQTVAKDFMRTNNSNFIEAGVRLWEIASASEVGIQLLNDYVQRLNLQNWKSMAPPGSVDSLVEIYLISNLRFVSYRSSPIRKPL